MTWSPLACGLITGKYSEGVPDCSRAAMKVRDQASGSSVFKVEPSRMAIFRFRPERKFADREFNGPNVVTGFFQNMRMRKDSHIAK